MSWIAAAMVAAVFLSMLTPVCAMPSCDSTSPAGSCSDFEPMCDQCPKTMVMKHTSDEAVTSAAQPHNPPAVVALFVPQAEPATVERALDAPLATASPPPLDALGVRLTI